MCATAYDEASDGILTMDTKADLQLAVTYSTELCAEAVRLVHEAVRRQRRAQRSRLRTTVP